MTKFLFTHRYEGVCKERPLVEHPKAGACFHFRSILSLSEHASDHACWCHYHIFLILSSLFFFFFFLMPVVSKQYRRVLRYYSHPCSNVSLLKLYPRRREESRCLENGEIRFFFYCCERYQQMTFCSWVECWFYMLWCAWQWFYVYSAKVYG